MITRIKTNKYAMHRLLGLISIRESILNDKQLIGYKFIKLNPKTKKEFGGEIDTVDLSIITIINQLDI
jgi:hypothetical protein